jgi:hypothetical protein
MNLNVLRNKLDLDKALIIQSNCCHKVPNQNIIFYWCYIRLNNQMGLFHVNFEIFKNLIKGKD